MKSFDAALAALVMLEKWIHSVVKDAEFSYPTNSNGEPRLVVELESTANITVGFVDDELYFHHPVGIEPAEQFDVDRVEPEDLVEYVRQFAEASQEEDHEPENIELETERGAAEADYRRSTGSSYGRDSLEPRL